MITGPGEYLSLYVSLVNDSDSDSGSVSVYAYVCPWICVLSMFV